jgi:PPOX class probable F420-dependent enzyme
MELSLALGACVRLAPDGYRAERLAALVEERYISLTTYKRDGTAVSTPVWVVTDDGRRLLVWSGAQSWKMRRYIEIVPRRAA